MAIAFLKTVNKGLATQSAQTMSLAAGVEVPTGSLLIIEAGRRNSGDAVASVADDSANAGDANVYTVDIGVNSGASAFGVISSYITRTIDADDIITVTWTNGSAFNFFSMMMIAYTGSEISSWTDQVASHLHFHTQAEGIVSGNTGTLSQADELVVGIMFVNDNSLTISAGSGYIERDEQSDPGDGYTTAFIDKVVSATTAVETTATWSGVDNKSMVGICVTYKEAAGGPVVYEVSFADSAEGSDAPSVGAILGASLSDGGVGADTPSLVGIFGVSASAGAVGGDTPSSIGTLGVTISDGGVGGDAPVIGLVYEASVSDGGVAGDTPSVVRTVNLSLADGAVVSDTVSAGGVLDISVADGAEASDTVSAIMEALVAVSDGAIGADMITATIVGLGGVVLDFTAKGRIFRIVAHDRDYRWDAKTRTFRHNHDS